MRDYPNEARLEFLPARAPSERARITTAVEEDILARDVAGVRAAQEGADQAKLIGSSKAARAFARAPFFEHLVRRLTGPRGGACLPAEVISAEGARQNVVDGHVVARDIA